MVVTNVQIKLLISEKKKKKSTLNLNGIGLF